MIIVESYNSPLASYPAFKVYSDKGFYIRKGNEIYAEAIVATEEEANNFIETSAAIPIPNADPLFVFETFLGTYRNISKDSIIQAKQAIMTAINSLDNEDLYKVIFFLPLWKEGIEYKAGEYIVNNNTIYRVLENHTSTNEFSIALYQRIEKPDYLIMNWGENGITTYQMNDRVKMGNYIYVSLINNNIWRPIDFPAAWQLERSQD